MLPNHPPIAVSPNSSTLIADVMLTLSSISYATRSPASTTKFAWLKLNKTTSMGLR